MCVDTPFKTNQSSHGIDHLQYTNFLNKTLVACDDSVTVILEIGCLYASCVLIFSGSDCDDWIDGVHLSVTESWAQLMKVAPEIVYGNPDMLSLLRSRIAKRLMGIC